MLFDPLCTDDLGLQLSYAATVGLVLGATALTDAIYSGERRLIKLFSEAVAVVLVAQTSVMPIQLYFFWKTGTLFMPANLLITPLVTPLTILGFATSTAALISASSSALPNFLDPLMAFGDAFAFIPLALMMLIVKAFCAVEGANIAVGQPSSLSVVFYYFCLIVWFISLRIKRWKLATTATFIAATLCLFWHVEQPLLCIASIHNHLIIVDQNRTACEVGMHNSKDKMVEKFISFHGAKLKADTVHPQQLGRNVEFVQVRDTLIVLKMTKHAVFGGDILNLANQFKVEHIVLLVSKADAMTDLITASDFEKANEQTRIEAYGMRGIEAVLYNRRQVNEVHSN